MAKRRFTNDDIPGSFKVEFYGHNKPADVSSDTIEAALFAAWIGLKDWSDPDHNYNLMAHIRVNFGSGLYGTFDTPLAVEKAPDFDRNLVESYLIGQHAAMRDTPSRYDVIRGRARYRFTKCPYRVPARVSAWKAGYSTVEA